MQDRPLDPLPAFVVHADWGSQPAKRWLAKATLQNGRYGIAMPEPVGDATTLVHRLQDAAGGNGAVLLGFDFAIGVPLAYAERAGIEDFLAVLPEFGRGEWERFYTVARNKEEVNLRQPFYPATSGQKGEHQLAYLINGLGVGSRANLLRRCDQAHDGVPAASPLFWSLGAKAVGKATILGWQQVLTPALARPEGDVRVWPFNGELRSLVHPGRVVIVETYPAEMYHHLGVSFGRRPSGERGGKQSQSGRRDNASALLGWASDASVELDPALRTAIEDGFGPESGGEEPFDALIGLCGMLDVVLGRRPSGEPDDERIRVVEGWMFGRTSLSAPPREMPGQIDLQQAEQREVPSLAEVTGDEMYAIGDSETQSIQQVPPATTKTPGIPDPAGRPTGLLSRLWRVFVGGR